MVEKLSRHIALWLIKSGILENDDIDLYIYAIQYLLLIINPTIIFTAYCIATHNITIGLIEIFSFLLIWLSSFIKPSLYMFIALIIADMELIIKGPVISINHSVSDSEKKYYHRCLIGILAVFNIIIIAATVLHLYRTASCISIVIIFCFISHIACMTEKNRKLYY